MRAPAIRSRPRVLARHSATRWGTASDWRCTRRRVWPKRQKRPSCAARGGRGRGAVVTVEPGLYLPGWGGVRLEDDIHLTPDGPRCLSDGRTDLLELH